MPAPARGESAEALRRRSIRRLAVGVAILLPMASCNNPAPGSKEDLVRQVDALDVPASMTQLDDNYLSDCESCPSYVRWYDVDASPDAIWRGLRATMKSHGLAVRDAPVEPQIYAATGDAHVFFVVVDRATIANNEFAPDGADVEISVRLLEGGTPPS